MEVAYRIGGLFGMINGVIVTALPTVVITIALIGVLSAYRRLN
ncbi:hypothetical protein [Oceanobacillus sojae]|nr:hypothetical protein [Oceanobacillus sojae]